MTQPEHHRLAVVGLGALGVLALEQAARSGIDAVGVDPHPLGHDWGASGGQTRIFRMAYKEGAEYLPLLHEAAAYWAEAQSASDETLWQRTGALAIGRRDDPEMGTLLQSIELGGLPSERIRPEEARERWPQHRVADDDIVVADPQGGLLRPAAVIRTAGAGARAHGAALRLGRRVTRIEEAGDGLRLELDDGTRLTADRAIVTTGPWIHELVPSSVPAIELRRVILHWYPTLDGRLYGPETFPVGIRRSGPGRAYSFFPQIDSMGIKVNFHLPRQTMPSMTVPLAAVDPQYSRQVSAAIPELFSGVRATPSAAAVFVDGYTASGRPVLDRIPGLCGAWMLAGGSGQAFKMAPALARIALDAALDRAPLAEDLPLSTLSTMNREATR